MSDEELIAGTRSERCGTCRFWPRYPYAEVNNLDDSGIAGGPVSDCRRHAPIANIVTGGSVWPETRSDDWCGEFEWGARHTPAATDEGASG